MSEIYEILSPGGHEAMTEQIFTYVKTYIDTHGPGSKVDRAGDTMSGALNMSDAKIFVKDTDINTDTNPSSDVWGKGYYLTCDDDVSVGYFRAIKAADGKQGVQVETNRTVSGTRYTNCLNLRIANDGTNIVEVSNPAVWRSALRVCESSGVIFYSGNQSNSEHDANNALKNGHYYYTSNGPATSLGASTNDGALYVQSYSDSWVAQIAQDYRNGNLFVRGKNNGTWQAWKAVSMSGHTHSYLPLSGGTLTGNLKIGNLTLYSAGSNGGINSMLIGDDVTIGDCNAGGCFGMKSTGTNAGFKFYNSSGGSIGGLQSTNGTLQWINSGGTAYNLLHGGNYTDYTVTKTGSGASGTWGINITGSAYRLRGEPSNTINSTANDTTANWGKQLVSAHWYNTNGLLNHQPTQWFHLLNLTNGGSETCQIAMISNQMWIRGGNASGWGSNFTPVLTTANQSSITACNRGNFGTVVTAASDAYVLKGKGTYTGNGYTGYCVAGRDTGHFYQLNWTGSALQHYVDGTNVGSSDMRLKKDKKRLTDDEQILDIIDECGIYSYKHIDDDDKTSFGIMAQAFKWKCKERGLNPEDYVLFQKTEHSLEDYMQYYTIEYDQYLVLKCASQDRKINRLEQRIRELEVMISR